MGVETHEEKLLWEPEPGRKTRIVTDELLEAQYGELRVKNSRGTQLKGATTILQDLFPGS